MIGGNEQTQRFAKLDSSTILSVETKLLQVGIFHTAASLGHPDKTLTDAHYCHDVLP
jgi:hypothetical protein